MPYFIAQQRVQPTPYQQPTKEFETFVSPALARAHTITLGSATDKWKNEAVKVQPADGTYFLSVTPAEFNMDSSAAREGRAASAAAATLLPSEMPTRKQAPNATVEERFQCILEQVVVAGFESFDAMATAYYALNFSSNSALADEQRLSRSRRLPRVISDIHSAASSSWSDWERRGFLHEILRTAEVILSSEGDGARPSVGSKIVELVQAQDIGDTRVAAGAMFEIKRVAQGQLPNIWAVAMALAAGTGHRCNRDRSDVALATTLILSSATSISSD
ncbi:uncharacterized protein F5Z01DRAFT_678403 [Emericellopsis atlantica]|uniref:Uncharacterized protein n=1 Tax=Emericellopsis atlantica TaxID=2614577 RepID=A0A9P7ZCW7_9HYPO|nr:uncharacterized protein F5Z01DRAFT_678403 [Emericellopsis atlantica]KAG9249769.1 hypothetical protein F5Z01DRAFT_678403 [Emericellopsis atlantica]